MSPENNELDKILSEIRSETPDPEVIEAAAARVRARLPHAPLSTCADFRALMPDYRAGRLSEARALLLKDHTRECVACRKVLEGSKVVAFTAPRRATAAPWFRWAMAAGVAALAVLAGWGLYNTVSLGGGRTVVQAASGSVYRVSGDLAEPLASGAELPGAAEVRTAKDSGAVVRLPDASLVEMRERSAFSVSASGRDLTVRLTRGSIIVQAAKRRTGHLYVATRDCRVAVTGTVFSVNSGVKGSRVSVIEGEVHVAQDGQEKVLHPGDQYASSASIAPVPVTDEIAWSRNFDQHVALLREFSALQKQLEQVRMPDARYSSRLLGMLPADTVVYAAIPNLGRTLAETQNILRQRVDQSPVLRQWWDEKLDRGGALDKAVAELRRASEYLGDEIVITAPITPEGKPGAPVVLSEVRRTGFADYLKALPLFQTGSHLRIANSLDALAPVNRNEAVMYLGNDIAAISPDAAALRRVLAATGGFAGTPLGARVAESYRDGAGFVFAADLEKLIAANPAPGGHHEDRPGFDQLKYALFEQRQTANATDTHAVLAFRGPRKGVAAWLGKPAPIGALDYVSPDANLASAFTVKNPAAIFDELLSNQEARDGLAKIEAELGINVRNDLIAALGGEIVVALDGPTLPVPSWKIVAEVYDPGRLQTTIQRFVEAYNKQAPAHGKSPAQLTQEVAAGRTWYRLVIPGAGQYGEADYTFAGGYLIAAPSRALVERAINYRATGYTLTRSAAFTSLLPRDRYADFSAMYYQNVGGALNSLASLVPGKGALTPEQQKSLDSLAAELAKPMLVTVYGEEDRITLASNGTMLALNPANMLRMASPGAILSTMQHPRAARRTARN